MFDYDSPSVPDTVVADVVAAIRNDGKLPPLSDEEREQRRIEREIYLWKCRERDEERQAEYERQQAETEAAARQEAALEIAEANRKARLERQAQIDKAVRERELADLRFQVRSHQVWQTGVQRAVRNTIADQARQALLTEMDALVNPPSPAPAPEPEVVYVEAAEGSDQLGDRDFSADAWMKKSRSWW